MKKPSIPLVKIIDLQAASSKRTLKRFVQRPSVLEAAEKASAAILADVRKRGDAAIVAYTERFDGVVLSPRKLQVSAAELKEAGALVDPAFQRAAREAHKRIAAFSKASLRPDWKMKTPQGGMLGEKFLPLDRIGAYVPGGAAPLVSTSLMTLTLAKVAGVAERIAFTPPQADGSVNPFILFAMQLAGATEIYRFGGVPAIAAMAYGTKRIQRVQKIVGPGNAFVTAAKKLVFGEVNIDMLAGPSEIAVLADTSVKASYVASDLLAQAEHGTGLEKSLLVTTSKRLAQQVQEELVKQAARLPRLDCICQVLREGTLIVVVPSLEAGVEVINDFAPEHFELLVRSPGKWEKKIRTAGAIFIGPWTPESAGDFAAGPSHVLPTGGTSAMFSGLTVDDFRRRTSLIQLTKKDLVEVTPVIEAFGRVETLDAHVRSAQVRFE